MFNLIFSNLQNILVGAAFIALFAFLVTKVIKNRKKGSCCGCSSCSASSFCHPRGEK